MKHMTVPLGISSQPRTLPDVDGETFIVAASKGPRLTDTAGRSFVDYGMAMGACLVGHAHPAVVAACTGALQNGPMPGFRNDLEEAAGEALVALMGPRIERITFVTTGTEAVHLACRMARGATGRRLIAKAAGGYDGWFDPLRLGNVGSPEADPANNARPLKDEITLFRVNDIPDIEKLFQEHGADLAAILVEPMLGNTACLVPDRAFFERLTELAQANGTMIISDEVMVGLRLGRGLVSEQLGLVPDLVTMGKAIGSGIAVAAVLGTAEAFRVTESGQVMRFGTYHGNPLAMQAVLSTMGLLDQPFYDRLNGYGAAMRDSIAAAFAAEGIVARTSGFDAAFSLWFCDPLPKTLAEAMQRSRPEATRIVYESLRRNGVVALPSPWGRYFVSGEHGAAELEITRQAFAAAARAVAAADVL